MQELQVILHDIHVEGMTDITRDEQETIQLFKELETRTRTKKIKDCANGLNDGVVAMMENLMKYGTWFKFFKGKKKNIDKALRHF